jgi:hypothetical protein
MKSSTWVSTGMGSRAMICLHFLAALAMFAPHATAQTYPLSASPNHRYVVDKNGAPVLLNGDAAWAMFGELTYNQASLYLTDRANRGMNMILASLPEPFYTEHPPNNIYNVPPFTGAAFATPNEAYFKLADSMIQKAADLNLVMLVDPLYIGYGCSPGAGTGPDGWCTDIKAASLADMRTFGTYMGNRYKTFANIIWIVGGDVLPSLAGLGPKIDTFIAALQQVDTIYPGRLISAHGGSASPVMTDQFTNSWLTLNGIYTWDSTYITSIATMAWAYNKPFIGLEFNYEAGTNNISPTMLRAQHYWAMLAGCCGVIYGNNPMWYFGSTNGGGGDWQAALNSPGANYMKIFGQFFRSLHWYSLIPDRTGSVITAGAASGANEAAFGCAADSSSIVGYMPTARSVTINPAGLKGDSIHVRWFNPSTGVFTTMADRAKVTSNYSPPQAGDWALVLDGFKGNAVTPPSAPTNLTPLNGATGVPVNPVLAWTSSSGATSYRVQVSANPAFSSTVIDSANIAGTSVSIGGLGNNQQYYWHVIASNAGGPGGYSASFSFTTIVSPPAPPTLVFPANAATGLNTSLSVVWRSSATATSYRLQTSLDPNFGTTVINQTGITDTTYQLVGLGLNVKLYWRVSSANAGGSGSFGSPFNFTTITSSTDIDDNPNGMPTHFALGQNFPNPFNPTTEINFAVPTRSLVRLDIYNTLGNLVTTLVDREFSAGRYHATWSGTDNYGNAAPSGVYLYRLTAGDFVDTKKMLLLK